MFTENDVGKNKIEILKKELQQRNSEIIIDILDLKISKYDDLKKIPKSDLVVLSADKPANLINWINKYGVINNIPYINVGYVLDIAVWGPLVIPGETGCWECQSIVTTFENQNEEIKNMCYEINKNFQAPSIGSINMMTASYATLDILKYLGEFGKITSKNKRIGIWTHNLEIEYQDCSKNKECKICSKVY
jgi:molybdopterin-synthase adenylyltransferase